MKRWTVLAVCVGVIHTERPKQYKYLQETGTSDRIMSLLALYLAPVMIASHPSASWDPAWAVCRRRQLKGKRDRGIKRRRRRRKNWHWFPAVFVQWCQQQWNFSWSHFGIHWDTLLLLVRVLSRFVIKKTFKKYRQTLRELGGSIKHKVPGLDKRQGGKKQDKRLLYGWRHLFTVLADLFWLDWLNWSFLSLDPKSLTLPKCPK